jgi:hypothetical protein
MYNKLNKFNLKGKYTVKDQQANRKIKEIQIWVKGITEVGLN